MVQSVRSTYGREMMSPSSFSFKPFFSFGAIIRSAEINCELTLPCISSLPPSSSLPVMRSGGNPSFSAYSMSAPSLLSASTRIWMGRFFILSVPVMTCVPGVTARKAVMNRIAVPAAFMSIVSGMYLRASMITSVSSQSERLSGRISPPDRA